MKPLLIDYYSGNRQPNFGVFSAAGFKAGIRKFSMQLSQDTELDIDIPAQRAAGWGIAGYHWCDPIPAPAYWYRQADHFLRAVDTWKPSVLALDVEQWWSSWTYIDKDHKLAASRILDNAAFIYDYVRARSDLPILIYTARWFTSGYCPQLGPWIGAKPAWIAHYYLYGTPGPIPISASALGDLIPKVVASPIATPTGVTNIVMRQFESKLWLDGTAHNYDTNIWLADDALFYEWFKLEPPAPPGPTLEERVTRLEQLAHQH